MGKRLQVYEAAAITVTFDPNLCIHARECVRGLPEVFDPTSPRWIRPDRADADRVADVVRRCPTGALQVARPGQEEAAVTPRRHHPRGAEWSPLREGAGTRGE